MTIPRRNFLEKIAYFKADVFIALYNDAYIAALARASKAKIRIGPISKLNSFLHIIKEFYKKDQGQLKMKGNTI